MAGAPVFPAGPLRMPDPASDGRRGTVGERTHEEIVRHRPSTAMVTGTDSAALAATAIELLNHGWRIVLPPSTTTRGQLPESPCTLRIDCHDTVSVRREDVSTAPDGGWVIAMATSGSTGPPKLFGFTAQQLRLVTSWYRDVYRISEHSLLVTALPTVHNLAFVAGVCTAAALGATFAHVAPASRVLDVVEQHAPDHDRVIVLANPVVLEPMLHRPRRLPENVLIDSGGAPLARSAIAAIRTDLCDIREGYGTTETLSLTHFDRSSGPAAIGTVGKPLDGVSCRLASPKPAIEVATPLMGTPLTDDLHEGPHPDWIPTGDVGQVTAEGNLRLVGRIQDEPIADLWPRDVLDAVGPVLGYRTALVTHQRGTIGITTHDPLSPGDGCSIRRIVLEAAGAREVKRIEFSHYEETLYSAKLPRSPVGAFSDG